MNDTDGAAFVQRVLPELSEAERQFVDAVGRFETNRGAGWVGLAKKLGMADPEQYADVGNWGAITSSQHDPAVAFFMRDRWWRRYPSLEDGLRDAARTILKSNVRAALAQGDGAAAVAGMGKNGYFIEPESSKDFGGTRQQQIAKYSKNVQRNYEDMVRLTGMPSLLSFAKASSTSKLGDFVIAGTFVGGLLAAILLLGGVSGPAGGPKE